MIAELKPYPTMKDSGVEWLGEVPKQWKQLPASHVIRRKNPKYRLQIDTVLSHSFGKIIIKPPEKLHRLVPASFETYQIIEPNDIVIRPTDL